MRCRPGSCRRLPEDQISVLSTIASRTLQSATEVKQGSQPQSKVCLFNSLEAEIHCQRSRRAVSSNATNSPSSISLSGMGVTATAHTVALSWAPAVTGVAGFRTYVSMVSGGPYVEMAPYHRPLRRTPIAASSRGRPTSTWSPRWMRATTKACTPAKRQRSSRKKSVR